MSIETNLFSFAPIKKKGSLLMLEHLQAIFEQFQATTVHRRAQLYGLAMLHSLRYRGHVAHVLGTSLKPPTYLHYLYREHEDLFTDYNQHTLQPEIRTKLRRYLLEIRCQRDVQKLAEDILAKQQIWFSNRENDGNYGDDLCKRLESSDWCERFLDVLEAYYWVDPDQGVRYALAFFLAASLYHPHIMREIADITAFFEEELSDTMRQLWIKTSQSFGISNIVLPPAQCLEYLGQVRTKLQQKMLMLPELFMVHHSQLIGALWWQEGEMQRKARLDKDALEAYKNALASLYTAEHFPHYVARLYYVFARQVPETERDTRVFLIHRAITSDPGFADAYGELGDLYGQVKDSQRASLYYHYAIELKPHKVEAWVNLGAVYVDVGKYKEAIDELTVALRLDPDDPYLYYNRALALQQRKQFKEALADLDKALDLDLSDVELAWAYVARGNIHAMDKAVERAAHDYQQALQLAPNDMQAHWLYHWIHFGKRRPEPAEMQPLQELANFQREHYLAALCRGLYVGIVQRDLQQAFVELEHAQKQEEKQWDAYFWLALLHAYRLECQLATAKLQQALDLGLPVALLRPLYWLEVDSPDVFQQVAVPILQRYGV